VEPRPALQKPEPISAPEPGVTSSFWQRQWTFLRLRWWNNAHLTFTERITFFLRGVILIVVAAFGMLIVVHNTLNLNPRGMDAVAKLIAEFLLIPVGILALIIAGYGASQIVRSFMPNPPAPPISDQERAEDESEKFQLRDEDEP
jgi:hypothetical protein